jgi:hypothetical protein
MVRDRPITSRYAKRQSSTHFGRLARASATCLKEVVGTASIKAFTPFRRLNQSAILAQANRPVRGSFYRAKVCAI